MQRAMQLSLLAAAVGALRLPSDKGFNFAALPPAPQRNIGAEALAAASLLRRDVLPLSGLRATAESKSVQLPFYFHR